MGFLFWFVLRAIIMGVIGNSFYKWFSGTTWGIWFDDKLKSIMNKVTNKHDEAIAKKSSKIDMFDNDKSNKS